MSKTIVVPQTSIRKKILITLLALIGVALIVYEILLYFSASKKTFNIEMIALIRLSALILFLFIPLFLVITRQISISAFFYSFCFVAGFDSAMIGLYNLWLNQTHIQLINLLLVGGN